MSRSTGYGPACLRRAAFPSLVETQGWVSLRLWLGETAKRGRAIYVTTEDDVSQDFRPRLYAADAFMERVTFIGDLKAAGEGHKRAIDLQKHIPQFREFLDEKPDTQALILDPLHGFLPNADTNNDAKKRDALLPLGDLARDYRIAGIGVMHHN